MDKVKKLPRPDKFVVLWCTEPSGGKYCWITGGIHDTEEEAISDILSLHGVFKAHVIRVTGLETFHAPDTLISLTSEKGDVIEYTEDEDERDISD